jgi:hypothetical protein
MKAIMSIPICAILYMYSFQHKVIVIFEVKNYHIFLKYNFPKKLSLF